MANEEALVFDGLALNDGTTLGMLSLSAPPPRERQDWIGAADSETQLLVRKPLHENRKITARLVVLPQASMDLAHDKIALVVDKLRKASLYTDGISLTWTPATGTRTVTFDVLAGEITDLPIDWESGWLSKSPEFTVELTAKPYWRGTEVLTSTASSSTPFVTLEIAGVTGDVPALGRLIVTDTASQSRRHVEWGLEGLYYNSGTSLLLDSDSLVTSGFAGAGATTSGAYDPNATGSNVVFATIWAGVPIAVCGTGNLSHVGTFRVKARMQATAGTQVRLAWRAGDGPSSGNPWVTISAESSWVEVDLGSIIVPPVVVGSQRWTGQIEALNAAGNGGVHVDYLILVPALEGYGKARAQLSIVSGTTAAFDTFLSTIAGNALNARAAPLGGSWATSGDATDFVFDDNLVISPADGVETIIRSTAVVETAGRYAILGSTSYTDTQVDVRIRSATASGGNAQGLIARWTDSSNYLRFMVPAAGSGTNIKLEQVVAGVVTTLAEASWLRTAATFGVVYRLRLLAYASGRALAQVMSDAGSILAQIEANTSVLATSGTLQTGKPGIRDVSTIASATARRYTSFAVSAPAPEPFVLYSARNMQIRHDDVIRQDSTGTYTGRPQSYRGSRFLVPVGTSRVLVKGRRNDIEATGDANVTDALQIQVGWTPRGLAIPR